MSWMVWELLEGELRKELERKQVSLYLRWAHVLCIVGYFIIELS